MSGLAAARFRLLDPRVGWDPAVGGMVDLSGATGPGLQLALLDPDGLGGLLGPAGLDGEALTPFLPPARITAGCGPCQHFLVAPAPAARLLVYDPCAGRESLGAPGPGWRPARHALGAVGALVDSVAVASRGHFLAISDAGRNEVVLLQLRRGATPQRIPVANPGPLAFAPGGDLIVTSGQRLLRFDPSGLPRGAWSASFQGAALRLAIGCEAPPDDDPSPGLSRLRAFLLVRRPGGELRLRSALPGDPSFRRARLDGPAGLRAALPETRISRSGDAGFCLRLPGGAELIEPLCFSWFGRALPADVFPSLAPARATSGSLLTRAIDSGLPRCRWHRVLADVSLPPGTSLQISVATAEDPDLVPDPDDWSTSPTAAAAQEFLIQQPPGRWLFLRLQLHGDGYATPLLRGLRLDFPRSTSLDQLPEVFRSAPDAEDFQERFLSLFDRGLEDLDDRISRFAALLDPMGVPEEVLPWLGGFLDLGFDPSWSADRRRALLVAAPDLYRRRGTLEGLRMALRLALGAEPVIEELGPNRAWGALGVDARLRGVRLFSRARTRMRLGQSALGQAPLRSFGDPDEDPTNAGAFRIRVLVPPAPGLDEDRVRRLVESQKPAHVVAEVRVGGGGSWRVGGAVLGVDSTLGPPPAPILGREGNVRLGRTGILRPSRRNL